ncbi:retrovirus-related pol polyprotein from transposon TNT 1-94, partial [Tanacetum coccineum]
EVLVYVKDTCLCLTKPSEKLVVVTLKNKDKKVRFADPVTSSSNTQKQVDSHKTQDSNQPLLHSTGVICSNGASRSKPTGNKKNNRILQPSSSNKTNKVEDQSRSVKFRTNKKNRVSKTKCNADVIHSMLNVNSKSVCDVNALSKSKPAKLKNKKQIWKPTVPLKETTIKSVLTPTPGIKVYSRRPKATKSVGKIKKHSHKPKSEDTNQEKLYLLHMDLCGIMRVESINGKKYILVIVDDYSQFTRVKFLRSKDEAPKRIMETIHVDFDELTTMASEQSSSRPVLHEMTPRTLSLGLVPQPPSLSPFVPPTRIDWDTLFQPLFDEYFNPPPCVNHPVLEVAAPEPAVSTDTPSSTSVDQDEPSPSTSQTPHESPSQVIPPSVEEADHDIEVAHMDNNPYFGLPIPKPSSKESSS